MTKDSNYLHGIFFLSGSLFASGGYLAAYHFYTPAAWILFFITAFLAALGVIKILNCAAPSLPKGLKRAIQWIHSAVFEILSVALTFLLRPLGYLLNKSAFCGPLKGNPILLVHGYLHDASAWVFLKHSLCKAGFGPVYTLNLLRPFHSIRDHADLIAKKAEEIAKETGQSELTLIGHSMGGLVSAWYALKLAKPGTVKKVITIGSPLNGTHVASIAIGSNGREMRRGSDFVRELNDLIAKSDTVQFYHIASMADQMILPCPSALMGKYPEREYIIEDIGHMTLLLSPRVANQIKIWLPL